jgi:hypothetical protein
MDAWLQAAAVAPSIASSTHTSPAKPSTQVYYM